MTHIRWPVLSVCLLVLGVRAVHGHNGAVAIAVPVEGITIDGDLSDWPEGLRRYPIAELGTGERPTDNSDLEAWFRVGYSAADNALYVAVEARDQSVVIDTLVDEPWVRWWELRDGCEVYVDLEHRAVDSPSVQNVIYGQFQHAYGALAAQRHEQGHRYEWRLDLTQILTEPYMHVAGDRQSLHSGMTLGFDVSVSDRDRDGTLSWMVWGRGGVKNNNTNARGNLILSEEDEFAFYAPGTTGDQRNTEVRCIAEASDGALWVGTWDGARRFDGRQFRDPDAGAALHGVPVNTILQDRQGNMWFGTVGRGVARYDGRQMVWIAVEDGLAVNIVSAMLEDRLGRIWCGTLGGGLSCLDGEELRSFGASDGLPGAWVFDIAQDRAGNLWLGTERGVSRYDGQAFTTLTVADGLVDDVVEAVAEDGHGNLWFGTMRGVSRYDGQAFTNFTMDDELAANSVVDIIEDHGGQLWIGFDEVRVNLYDGLAFQVLTGEHGLLAESITCLFEDSRDDIWIGTNQGLIRYRPQRVPPSVAITKVAADRQYGPVQAIAVPSTQDYVSFEFLGASSRTAEDQLVYAYRLAGMDPEWRATRQRRVEYTELPVGEYEFQVRAVDRDLTYSEQPASVRVRIHPPYGLIALWSALGCALVGLAIASGYGVRRSRESNRAREAFLREQTERLAAQEQLAQELEDELQDARRLQMSLMPTAAPAVSGISIAGRCVSANHVGGDFFQYFQQDGGITISLADVTGHAMEAAIPAVMFSGILDKQMEFPGSLEERVAGLNRSLCRSLGEHTFVCLSMVDVEAGGRVARLANAGCPYPLHYHAATGQISECRIDVYPLGIRPDTVYQVQDLQLAEGDYLVLHSDGFSEATNAASELFGCERTAEVVRQACAEGLSPEAVVDRLTGEVKAFVGEAAQSDDMTCVVVTVEA